MNPTQAPSTALLLGIMAAAGILMTAFPSAAQSDAAANATVPPTNSPARAATNSSSDAGAQSDFWQQARNLTLGPFNLHPRFVASVTYDDNLSFVTANPESDCYWNILPGIQAVAGDDAALTPYRDQNAPVLDLSPGNIIIQPPEVWPGPVLMLDYGPGFQIFDRYKNFDSTDQFATFNLLWPRSRLIVGLKQIYAMQKEAILVAGERATVENINTILSFGYQISSATSLESDWRRSSIGYDQPALIGFTEYATENWLNYEVLENLPVSVGLLAGEDVVVSHQDQTYQQLRLRARYTYTQKLAFDASVGGELREFEDGRSSSVSPVFTVVAEYQPSERTALTLSGTREVSASIINGFNYTTTGVDLGAHQAIGDRFGVGLSVGYSSVEYSSIGGPNITHNDGNYNGRVTADAKLVRHLTGQVFYQLTGRSSQFSGNFTDDRFGLQLNLNY